MMKPTPTKTTVVQWHQGAPSPASATGKIEKSISHFYYTLAHHIADHPWVFVIVPAIILLGFGVRIFADPVSPEQDPEDLYTPQDSVAFAQRIVVEESFGFAPVTNFFYLQAKDILSVDKSNSENQAALVSMLTLFNAMAAFTYEADTGETVTYFSRCNTTASGCLQYSVLNFFDYNETRITTDSDVMATINTGLQQAVALNQYFLFKDQIFGSPEPANASDPTIAKAQVLAHRFSFINKETRENGDLQFDTAREKWEIKASKEIRTTPVDVGQAYVLFSGDVNNEANSAVDVDVALLPFGYMLLIAYASFVLWRRHPVYSYASMAMVSLASIGLSIVGMWGFGLLIGLNLASVWDDTFVIMGAHRDVKRSLSAKERVARALARGGVSITITSITDIVAFGAGNLTRLPSISLFCTYTLLGILFDFLLQVTFVVAFLYWNTIREGQGRAGEFDPDAPSSLDVVIGEWLPKVLLHPVSKVVVLLIAAALAGTSLWAATKVTTRFDVNWFIPSNSHAKDAVHLQSTHFNGRGYVFGAYTGPTVNGYEAVVTQADLQSLSTQLLDSKYVIACNNWWTQLLLYVQLNHPANMTAQGLIQPSAFYPLLDEFLASPFGERFTPSVLFNETTSAISKTEITCEFADLNAMDATVDGMRDARNIVNAHPSLGDLTVDTDRGEAVFPFAYSFVFLFIDGEAVIQQETLRNVLIAGVTVAVVTLLLLANIPASFVVVLMLALVDVNVLGFMYYVNVDFNSVSAVNIVIAVGLAIDSSVHIAHAFLSAHGTRNERVAEALRRLGRSVTNGAVSTFLAIVLLANAQSYIFQVLFKLLSLILGFAFFHGIIVLPVVLSLIGPDPYPLKPHEMEGLEDEEIDGENGVNGTTNGSGKGNGVVGAQPKDSTPVVPMMAMSNGHHANQEDTQDSSKDDHAQIQPVAELVNM
ncbi:hypothetical protein PTSG_10460 [Salpingoeca rosetta]|uniref:SSD domain-containing protein n=1 Tax=Salpingoeca rosetta (strain ATCC 50818 / BSB-021) TaxID=946362 RepID=F2UPQ8_SALR5|nr:uncharacterized protein PTSG_10460 [Salpingoeca rosetta]EGD79613.1 hypothetical protein PTSG_10460 [Salpingoeca rosetta]|eukprot:XP_004988841.1 hypothetical protein PTSG_10460 [Salpingoeca rosetta]